MNASLVFTFSESRKRTTVNCHLEALPQSLVHLFVNKTKKIPIKAPHPKICAPLASGLH